MKKKKHWKEGADRTLVLLIKNIGKIILGNLPNNLNFWVKFLFLI